MLLEFFSAIKFAFLDVSQILDFDSNRTLVTRSGPDSLVRFTAAIRPLRISIRWWHIFAVSRRSDAGSRFFFAFVLFNGLVMTGIYILLASPLLADSCGGGVEPEKINWCLLLGDLGYSFGYFRKVFDLGIAVSFGGLTFIFYFATYSVINDGELSRVRGGGNGSGGAERHASAWRVWQVLLVDQNLSPAGLPGLGPKTLIRYWQFFYLAQLVGFAAIFGSAFFACCFLAAFNLPVLPETGFYWIYAAATGYWIFHLTGTVFIFAGYIVTGNLAIVSQFTYYSFAIRGIVRDLRRSAHHKFFPLVQTQTFAGWQALEQDFCWSAGLYNRTLVSILPACTTGSIFWFYSACYFAGRSFILRGLIFFVAAICIWASCFCVLSAAWIVHEQEKLAPVLFSHLLGGGERVARSTAGGAGGSAGARLMVQARKSLLRRIRHETRSSFFAVSFGSLSIVSFENSIGLLLETIVYYLLFVSIIGIPSDSILTQ